MEHTKIACTGNLPEALQELISAAIIGYVDYPDRTAQWERIRDSLQNGDYQLATIQLNSLCNQQDNFRLSHYAQ